MMMIPKVMLDEFCQFFKGTYGLDFTLIGERLGTPKRGPIIAKVMFKDRILLIREPDDRSEDGGAYEVFSPDRQITQDIEKAWASYLAIAEVEETSAAVREGFVVAVDTEDGRELAPLGEAFDAVFRTAKSAEQYLAEAGVEFGRVIPLKFFTEEPL